MHETKDLVKFRNNLVENKHFSAKGGCKDITKDVYRAMLTVHFVLNWGGMFCPLVFE